MTISATIIADSLHPSGNSRLTTFELTFPRVILAEVLTHRIYARNTSSSRAIPTERLIELIQRDPYIPIRWGRNRPGMSSGEDLAREDAEVCEGGWLELRDAAIRTARTLASVGLGKEHANRVLEPWMHVSMILTGDSWDNLFRLRISDEAQPEFRELAVKMRHELACSVPNHIDHGDWHVPYPQAPLKYDPHGPPIPPEVYDAVGRVARVSYMRHAELTQNAELAKRLLRMGHMSPWEHCAQADMLSAPARPWLGWRTARQIAEICYFYDATGIY